MYSKNLNNNYSYLKCLHLPSVRCHTQNTCKASWEDSTGGFCEEEVKVLANSEIPGEHVHGVGVPIVFSGDDRLSFFHQNTDKMAAGKSTIQMKIKYKKCNFVISCL